jgi:2-hydroxychromene-2-carboxylate isomerase
MHPRIVQALVSQPLRRLRHALAWRPGLRATYYHRVDDPDCVLLLQALPTLCERTGLAVTVCVVGQPAEDVMPDPERAAEWARIDAVERARWWQVDFDPAWTAPTGALLQAAQAASLAAGDDLEALLAITRQAWEGQAPGGLATDDAVRGRLTANTRKLRRAGHYNSATLHFRGEWYWGLDRLGHLESRLNCPPIVERRASPPSSEPVTAPIDFFFSFRSPYSYLALARTRAIAEQPGVQLRIRPVLPMVMRGLPVPFVKRLYIVRDCAREARRLGIPFGRVADPVGVGVERCMAVFAYAERVGQGFDWLQAVATCIWAEGVDVATDLGLRTAVEKAGLDWADAQSALADEGWRQMVADNRQALLNAGLWGVPSYVCGDRRLWGQDRIEILKGWLGT